MTLTIDVPKEKIEAFCIRNKIKKLAFFGSVLHDDFNPTSDVDILVEFDEANIPGFFNLMRIQDELSKILGRCVDLRTSNDLSKYFLD
jgi:predicted nucleotidyltransferase